MNNTRMRWMAAGLLSLTASLAQAGEQIHLRVGSFDPMKAEALNQFVPANLSREQAVSNENFIVQFKQRITANDRSLLISRGLNIVGYMPDDAYIVSGEAKAVKGLESLSQIRAVAPMLTTWKISPDFGARSVFTLNKMEDAIVRLRSAADNARFQQEVLRLSSVRVVADKGEILRVILPSSELDSLAALETVLWIEPRTEMTILPMSFDQLNSQAATLADDVGFLGDYTDLTGFESGTKVMQFEKAWARGYTGRNQKVAMADTGLDSGVPSTLSRDFKEVKKGYSFGLYAKGWEDPMGHGTHVAGSVTSSGEGNNGTIRGGAYTAEMIPQGMWSPVLNNLTVPDKLADLFQPAYNDGARVHTNSWGGARRFGAYDNFAIQADDFIWKNPDMLIVFAAGNSGVDGNKDGRIDENSMASPGTAKNVLTVGASENYVLKGGIQRKLGDLLDGEPWGVEPLASDTLSNNPDGIAAFSSRGPALDGRTKPDVVAPGTNVLSNCSHQSGASPLWGNYNADYCFSGGTSMSTPLVAGSVAVVREYLIQEWKLSSPSAAMMKGLLMHSADDLYPGQYGEIGKSRGQELLDRGPNSDQGYGRVNVDRATTPKSEYFYELVDYAQGVRQGERIEFNIPANKAQGTLKATLVYTDAPGTANAAKALVNDLDLEVSLGNGQVLKSESRVNNHEQVVIDSLPSGAVKVSVLGTSIPQGKDGKLQFALILTK